MNKLVMEKERGINENIFNMIIWQNLLSCNQHKITEPPHHTYNYVGHSDQEPDFFLQAAPPGSAVEQIGDDQTQAMPSKIVLDSQQQELSTSSHVVRDEKFKLF